MSALPLAHPHLVEPTPARTDRQARLSADPLRTVPTLAEFLRGRRNAVDPASVGLVSLQSRRVVGLRREEVAALAGISPEYYVRLEQGRDHQPSDQVLEALARALRVGGQGLAYMRRLSAEIDPPTAADHARILEQVAPLLEAWRHVPAYVTDPNFDVVLTNPMAAHLSGGRFAVGANVALQFFTPESRALQPHWHEIARTLTAWLRMTARRGDPRSEHVRAQLLSDEYFRDSWERYDVGAFSGNTAVHTIGPLAPLPFDFVTIEVAGASGYLLFTYHAAPGTPSAAALAWARAFEEAR